MLLMRCFRLITAFSLLVVPVAAAVSTIEENDDGGSVCNVSVEHSPITKAAEPADDHDDAKKKIAALFAWVRSLGGFVDGRLVVRRANPYDPTSVRGMFATGDIARGETIFTVPLDAIIGGEHQRGEENENTVRPHKLKNACHTARTLAREMELGQASKYAPLVAVLRDDMGGDGAGPPSFWSEAGRALLDTVLGPHLPPRDYMRYLDNFHRMCSHHGNSGNPDDNDYLLSDEDIMLFSTRAVRNMIVPVYVFANHRNRPWSNFHVDVNEKGFGAVATRDIAQGEEIHYWYGLGAHNMFSSFGFVENFPQRWVFDFDAAAQDSDDYGHSSWGGNIVEFDLDKQVAAWDSGTAGHTSTTTSFSVTWVKPTGGPPSKATIDLLQSELVRLGTLRSPIAVDEHNGTNIDDHVGRTVPRDEEEATWQYHRALTFAISQAITAAAKEYAAHAQTSS